MTPANTLDFRAFEPLEEQPDHVQADSGTSLLNFSDGKKSRLGINGGFDEGGLGTTRRFDLSGTHFKLGVAAPDDGEQEIHPRRQFVFTLMPALGTAVETFVVVLLRFFVSGDFATACSGGRIVIR